MCVCYTQMNGSHIMAKHAVFVLPSGHRTISQRALGEQVLLIIEV